MAGSWKLAEFGKDHILNLARHIETTLHTFSDDTLLDEWYDLKQISMDCLFPVQRQINIPLTPESGKF